MAYAKTKPHADSQNLEKALRDLSVEPSLPKVDIRPSPIHELGVFAQEPISRGRVVFSESPLLSMFADEPLDESELRATVSGLSNSDMIMLLNMGKGKEVARLLESRKEMRKDLKAGGVSIQSAVAAASVQQVHNEMPTDQWILNALATISSLRYCDFLGPRY